MDNRFQTEWLQIRSSLRDKWRDLSQEDIDQINGNYDLLISKLQQRYGYSREQAEEYAQNWISERISRFTPEENRRSSRGGAMHEARHEEGRSVGSLWRWVFGLGIPLLLLISYFNTREMGSSESAPSVPRTATPADSTPGSSVLSPLAADRRLADSIRMTLMSNSAIARDLASIRITSLNGVVTLSGTVPSQEQSDRIFDTVRSLPGVNQVDNQLMVR